MAAFGGDAEELDLPVVGGRRPAPQLDDLDLPASVPQHRGGFGDVDLPLAAAGLPASTGGGFGELDLPALGSDLPAIAGDLPSVQAGLPSPAAGLPQTAAGLPQTAAGLPQMAAGLPQMAAGLPMNAAGMPMNAAGMPMNAAGMPMNAAGMPMNAAGMPTPLGGATQPMGGGPGAFGEIDLGGQSSQQGEAGVVRQSGGGVSFGEVNLDAGQPGGSIDSVREEMEFGGLPQEGQAAPPTGGQLQVRAPVPRIAGEEELEPPPKKKSLRAIAAVGVVLVLAGGALALVPNVGPFGVLWAYDKMKAGEYERVLADTSKTVRDALAKDTHPDAKRAYQAADAARSANKRQKGLAAYAVYVAYGQELPIRCRPRGERTRLGAARRAQVRRRGRSAQPGSRSRCPRGGHGLPRRARFAHHPVVVAPQRHRRAEPIGRNGASPARAASGYGRLGEGGGRGEERSHCVRPRANEVPRRRSQAGPKARRPHVDPEPRPRRCAHPHGARDLEPREGGRSDQAPRGRHDEHRRCELGELVEAHTLLGEVHLARSRVTHAEKSFSEALKIDPKSASALVGLGDALYRAGRYSEALARFEAAAQADAKEVTARVGVAKTALALERLQDAATAIDKLKAEFPKSVLVAYWGCKVQEAAGARKEAEATYRQVLAAGVVDRDLVLIHIGLAQLLTAQGKHDEAQGVLAVAQKALPDSALVRVAMGDIALGRGKTADAVTDYSAALKVDPGDIGAKFKLAIAYRRDKNFDLAGKAFDEVAAVDKEYPGLALERGLLFEASGRGAEALKAYEDALSKAPNDPDLMLRVACGKAGTQAAKQASEMLTKVLEKRPSSAEAHHCKGKALLTEGTNMAESLRTLEKAVDLDPNRAEYHLYVAWAANEVGRPQRAEIAVQKALELDQRLGDAYWQRGVLRQKQGAVRDAVKDLNKALELNPDRIEARAALGDSLYDLGRETEAITQYQSAVEGQPDNATWRYRYGKLLAANGRNGEAETQLVRALELAAKLDAKPRWQWEAHHVLARAMGENRDAIPHWEAFLRLGPSDNPYRGEAKKVLTQLGKPWDGN